MATQTIPETETATTKPAKWTPILGLWETQPTSPRFTGCEEGSSTEAGIVLADMEATTGVLRATVEINDTDKGCAGFVFGHSSADGAGFKAHIGGYGRAFSIARYSLEYRSTPIAGRGHKSNLKPQTPYQLELRIHGSNVRFRVDGTEVFNHNLPSPPNGDQLGLFAHGRGPVVFSEIELIKNKPRVFVVMQYSEPYNSLWEEVIKPVAQRTGFDPYRADNVFGPGIILQDIVRGISTSQAIIAEVTPHNPNVYYELGYAHAVGTPTVLLAEHSKEGGARLPFDISGFRCIFYEDAIRGKRKVEEELEKHLKNILHRSTNGDSIE